MKKLLLLCFSLFMAITAANADTTFQLAKVVKLGRGDTSLMTQQNIQRGFSRQGISDLSFPCDANCESCDHSTGICQKCTSDRYVSGRDCPLCPAKNYCDGVTAIPNCSGVVCLNGSSPQANDNGCCCM